MGFLFFASVILRSFILKLFNFTAIVLHGDRFLSPTQWALSFFMFWILNISRSASFKFCSVSAQNPSSHYSMPSKRKLSCLEWSSKILIFLLVSSLSFFNFSNSLLCLDHFSNSLLCLDHRFLSLYRSIDRCYL